MLEKQAINIGIETSEGNILNYVNFQGKLIYIYIYI